MTKSSITKGLIQAFIVLGLSTILLTVFAGTAGAQLIQAGDAPPSIDLGTGGETDIRALVIKIVNFALGFLGLLAVIMIIYGGIGYMTAAGNEEKVGKSKKIIMYAIIGIVIVLISFALVNTVIGGIAGAGGA